MSKKRLFLSIAFGFCAVGLFLLGAHGQSGSNGPPQFLTRPILVHVAEAGLDHGHFVFGNDAGTPAALAPNSGTSNYLAAPSSGSNLTTGTDRDVSNGADSYEGETGAAGTGTLVGTSNHIYPGNCSTSAPSGTFGDCAVKAYASSNGGISFTGTTISRTWNGNTFGITFDPGVDYDTNGTFYFSFGGAPLSGSYPNSVAVSKSTNGTTWSTPVAVTYNQGKAFDDKYYLAIDRSNNSATRNRIYVSWDRNQGNNQILYIASSANGGTTWSAPIKVNDGTSPFERVIGAYPAVDQNTGIVFDSWQDYAKNIIFVDKSSNGGTTWGKDVAAATTHAGFGTDIGCVGGRAQGPAHALKVGPSGALYLVYADPVTNRGFDILLTKSTNGGATWSTPVILNDDNTAADQFHPTLSVESNGHGGDKVTVSFYDRRDDPNNCLAYVYATQSTDSGAHWSANTRMTSAQSDFDGNPNGPGDYSSSTPFSSAVWPFFSDHRSTNPQTASGGAFDIYTVNVQ
jgi:hypothetical protein